MKFQFARPRLGWNRKWMFTISDGRYGTLNWVPPADAQEMIKALVSRRKLQAMAAVGRGSLALVLGACCLARQLSQPRGLPVPLKVSIRCQVICRF